MKRGSVATNLMTFKIPTRQNVDITKPSNCLIKTFVNCQDISKEVNEEDKMNVTII